MASSASDNTTGVTAHVSGILEYYALATLVQPGGQQDQPLDLSFNRFCTAEGSVVLPFKTASTTATVNKGLVTASWNGEYTDAESLDYLITYLGELNPALRKTREDAKSILEMIKAGVFVDKNDLTEIFDLARQTQADIMTVAGACTYNAVKTTNSDISYLVPAYSPYGHTTDTFRVFDASLHTALSIMCSGDGSIKPLTHPDVPGVGYTAIPSVPPQAASDVVKDGSSEAKLRSIEGLVRSAISCNFMLICLVESEFNYIKSLATMMKATGPAKEEEFKRLKSAFQTNFNTLRKSFNQFAGQLKERMRQQEEEEEKIVIAAHMPIDPKKMLPKLLLPVNDADFTLDE